MNNEMKKNIIDNPISVGEGETKTFENQTVVFKSFVGCKGNLVFKDCNLQFDDSEFSTTPVTMEKDGKLEMPTVSCLAK